MITPGRLSKNLGRTRSHPIPPAPNLITLTPTNRNLKTRTKTNNNNITAATSNLTRHPMPGTHGMITRSSASLLDKLQKLKDTPTTTKGSPMECDTDDIKKRTQSVKEGSTQKGPPKEKPNQTPTPEAKHSRNGATPLPTMTAQAMLREQPDTQENTTTEIVDSRMECIDKEEDKPKENSAPGEKSIDTEPQKPIN